MPVNESERKILNSCKNVSVTLDEDRDAGTITESRLLLLLKWSARLAAGLAHQQSARNAGKEGDESQSESYCCCWTQTHRNTRGTTNARQGRRIRRTMSTATMTTLCLHARLLHGSASVWRCCSSSRSVRRRGEEGSTCEPAVSAASVLLCCVCCLSRLVCCSGFSLSLCLCL